MTWVVVLHKHAKKALTKMPRKDMEAVLDWIHALEYGAAHPLKGNVRKLRDADADYRWRVGNYRIFFDIYDDEVVVYVIDIRRRTTTTYRK